MPNEETAQSTLKEDASSAWEGRERRADEEGHGLAECRRERQRCSTHRSAAGPPAPVLGDRRHTLRKKLRLYCMPKILHRVLGDRRREPGDEATWRLTGPGSSPNGRSTPAGEGKNSTAPHLPLLD